MPLNSTSKTRYEETARPAWVLGEDGNPAGVEANPVHVTGHIVLAGEAEDLELDGITGALAVIDVVHHEIHEGETFFTSYKTPDAAPLADDGTIAFGVVTGAHYPHVVARGACGGDMEGELYEGTTWTGGTSQNVFNKNRPKGNSPTVSVVRDPTISTLGTLLENEFVPGGTGPQAVGGAASQRAEWVLKPGTQYLFRITNRAGNNQPASLALEWYEESENA